MDDSDSQDVQRYPPSILIAGAALVAVLSSIVISVLMVSAASDDIAPSPPAPRIHRSAIPATPTRVLPEPVATNNLEEFIHHLTPQLPELDRLLRGP